MKPRLSLLPTFLTLLLCSCGSAVELTEQTWSYENGICLVTFVLQNNKYEDTARHVLIVAHKQGWQGDAMIDDIIGETRFRVELKPYERRTITAPIPLKPARHPSMVVVSHSRPQ